MYKILLAEDEAVVREGIRDNISWGEFGFENIVTCRDGKDAIVKIEEGFAPDVVITDIYMPFVDGLELAKYITQKKPDTVIVILSGYDDFRYAQQAVKLKAYDYILKPVTSVQLRELITKIRQELDLARRKTQKLEQLESNVTNAFTLLRSQFLNELVSSRTGMMKLDRKLRQFQVELRGDAFCAAVIDIDNQESIKRQYQNTQPHTLRYAVFNISEEISGKRENTICFQSLEGRTILLFAGKGQDTLSPECWNIISEISALIRENLGFTVSAGIGRCVDSLQQLPVSFSDAEYAIEYRFFKGNNSVIARMEIQPPREERFESAEYESRLADALRAGSREKAEAAVDALVELLRVSGMRPAQCMFHIQRISIGIYKTVESLELENGARTIAGALEEQDFPACTTLDEAGNALKKLCERLTDYVLSCHNSQTAALALRATEYIKEHYTEPSLSLLSTTKALFVSVSYFCSVFKGETGKTFLEYVNRLRMEKAQELLTYSDKSINEVAAAVGYTDHRYFSVVFKNFCSMTPKEYRLRQRADSGKK